MASSQNPYLEFGLAEDPAAWVALGVAVLAALGLSFRSKPCSLARPRRGLALLALMAGMLSHGYVHHYLRGGPRIIDATHYLLEARTIAGGEFAFTAPSPASAVRGRFLVSVPNRPERVGVLFPPGYPALLALGVLLGKPMWVGPLLAMLLVLATYAVARSWQFTEQEALVASGLSVISGTLRYHTADTMSHAWAALLVLLAAWSHAPRTTRGPPRLSEPPLAARYFAFTSRREFWSGLEGLSAGLLVATRPVTGAALTLVLLARRVSSTRHSFSAGARGLAVWFTAASLGVAPLLLQQHALTGSFWGSVQLAYYAAADGPPGCFRYGFGSGIGCLFEHGDYVRARLPQGYGLLAALATTARRCLTHSLDLANAAPIALALPVAMYRGRREPSTLFFSSVVVAVVAAYVPFYFEGSYPGGGARFYVDALPIEHVLLARGLVGLASTFGRSTWISWVWPVTLLGFALHTSAHHRSLRDREGGRPMFEPEVLSQARVSKGLVFVGTDHGFALGHDPRVQAASRGLVVARERRDASDSWLWHALGKPPVYRYVYEPSARVATPALVPLATAELDSRRATRRFEAESSWPPLAVQGGFAYPTYAPHPCVSRGRGLLVRATGGVLGVRLLLPRPPERAERDSARWRLGIWIPANDSPARTSADHLEPRPIVRALSSVGSAQHWERELDLQPIHGECWQARLPIGRPAAWGSEVELRLSGSVFLDFFELE
ncbi:MAG TPA: hypothetical protein VFQ61_29535 [Polyangiaceae bacterium]|nr:hypothetical protein [Polyangiaceae bacterium]